LLAADLWPALAGLIWPGGSGAWLPVWPREVFGYRSGFALIAAVLSVLGPPVGVVVLGLLLWLLVAGRGREEQKFAGLRILR